MLVPSLSWQISGFQYPGIKMPPQKTTFLNFHVYRYLFSYRTRPEGLRRPLFVSPAHIPTTTGLLANGPL
jgi:hypothetical protein